MPWQTPLETTWPSLRERRLEPEDEGHSAGTGSKNLRIVAGDLAAGNRGCQIAANRAGVYVGSLDSSERMRIVATRSFATYTPSGHLLFVQDGTLVAQPFDSNTLQTRGSP
jgi:hypothetical protein